MNHVLMDKHHHDNGLGRRHFRISVAGRLDARFIDGVDGIELGHSPDGSTLDGRMLDQSHLRGILDRLWQLGIEVLAFETYLALPNEPETIDHSKSPEPKEPLT